MLDQQQHQGKQSQEDQAANRHRLVSTGRSFQPKRRLTTMAESASLDGEFAWSTERGHVMSRPVIGIAMQTLEPIPGKLAVAWVMGMRCPRAGLLRRHSLAGPSAGEGQAGLRAIHDRLDGLFLVGGVDIDPGCYGERPPSAVRPLRPGAGRAKLTLIGWALAEQSRSWASAGESRPSTSPVAVLSTRTSPPCAPTLSSTIISRPRAGHSRDYLAHGCASSRARAWPASWGPIMPGQ